MPRLEVSFVNETKDRVSKSEIIDTLKLILRRLNHPDTLPNREWKSSEDDYRVSIEILIVGDKKIAELNRQFRDIDKPTDVLSFSETKSPHDDLLGSLVISTETATRQAKQAGIPLIEEIKVLAGHGFLHLLGYHHH